jgi:hypothetical protein
MSKGGIDHQNDLDYLDDNADRLARRKMKTDAMKRAFAINGGFGADVMFCLLTPLT